MTLQFVRALFDTLIEQYPTGQLERYLGQNAEIVNNVDFESGVVKIQGMGYSFMALKEKQACVTLLRPANAETGSPASDSHDAGTSIVERALKRQRRDGSASTHGNSPYIDTRFILPTSNLSERLFSTAGYAFSDYRKGLLPQNLEEQIFLKANRHLWDVETLSQAAKNVTVNSI